MRNEKQVLIETFNKACEALALEKKLTMENTYLIGELYLQNAQVNLNLSERDFLKKLNLSKDQFHMRAQAARLMKWQPKFEEALKDGEVCLSTLALVSSKVTEANSDVILHNIKAKTKREAKLFLSKVQPDGTIMSGEGSIELSITLKESDFKKLEEARSVLSFGGKLATNSEIIMQAIEDLLDRRDPVRKAERAKLRAEKKGDVDPVGPVREEGVEVLPETTNKAKVSVRTENDHRNAIPKHIAHAVWLRDGRQCTHVYSDRTRCEERSMLELDHRIPWAREGKHRLENLRVVCRRHNRSYAEQIMGKEFIERKIEKASTNTKPIS